MAGSSVAIHSLPGSGVAPGRISATSLNPSCQVQPPRHGEGLFGHGRRVRAVVVLPYAVRQPGDVAVAYQLHPAGQVDRRACPPACHFEHGVEMRRFKPVQRPCDRLVSCHQDPSGYRGRKIAQGLFGYVDAAVAGRYRSAERFGRDGVDHFKVVAGRPGKSADRLGDIRD